MLRFLVRRLIVALLVAATVMTLAFILTRLSGDLAISIAGPNATAADIEAVRKAYGLDRPVLEQFLDWVGRAVTGDLGNSYFFQTRVSTLIAERMPVTLTLGLTGLSLALLISIPMGILAAVRENTNFDRAVQMVALVGQAMPSFWLGLLLMIVFPLYFMVVTAFKFEKEIYSELTWIPREPTLSNFRDVIFSFHIPVYLRNTLFVALSTTLIVVVVSVLAGYALTRLRFPGRALMARGVLFVYLIPGSLLLILGAAGGVLAQDSSKPDPKASFFVTSVGSGKGADLGGLAGADSHCADLAKAASRCSRCAVFP